MWFGRRVGWETDAKHFVFALHPLAKTLRFSSFFYLSLTAAWALEVGWSLCSLILSDGFALSSLLLQNENLGQSDLPKAETHLSVFTTSSCKWVRLWKLPGGVLWMKEGEKTFTLIRYKCKRTECSLQMLPKKQALLYLAYEFIWVSECCYCGSVAWLFN